jgi:membrane protease YdiL (CAAX protease family)
MPDTRLAAARTTGKRPTAVINGPAEVFITILCASSACCWAVLILRRRRVAGAAEIESGQRPSIPPGAVIAAVFWLGQSLAQQVAPLVEQYLAESPRATDVATRATPDAATEPAFDAHEALVHLRRNSVVQLLFVGVLLLLLTRWWQQPVSNFGLSIRTLAQQVQDGGVAVTAAWLPVFLVLFATNPLRTEERAHDVLRMLAAAPTWESWFWAIAAAVVVAPIAEELLFRVILQSWLAQHLGPFAAIVLGSLLFASVHRFPDSLAIIPLALVLGYTFHRRLSYLAVVVAHGLFNGTMLVITAFLAA